MRNAFSQTLFSAAQKNKNLVLLTGDLGYTVFEEFQKAYPSRFFNMGVAEANMIGVATGMAMEGLIPFVYSIATFASMRGFEQIRTDVCVHNANVKIVGTGAGLSYGHAGTTHHSIEDIAILRSLPNMTIVCPSDPIQTAKLTQQIIIHKGPVYLRLGKRGETVLYNDKTNFKIGKGVILREGKKVALIATGNIVHNTLLAAELLARKGIHVTLIDMHTVKPIDTRLIEQIVVKSDLLYTIEEHTIIGGLGSAIAEVIAEQKIKKKIYFQRIGIPDSFFDRIGSQEYLRGEVGLTPEKISSTVQKGYKQYA